jgi:hypothetical protein
MNDDDRRFLTEAMGECWHESLRTHEDATAWIVYTCPKCHKEGYRLTNRTFTTPDDFFAVWTSDNIFPKIKGQRSRYHAFHAWMCAGVDWFDFEAMTPEERLNLIVMYLKEAKP